MYELKFQVETTNQSVSVRMDAGRTRFYALAFFISVTAFITWVFIMLPGKHGSPSIWHDLSNSSVTSADFWMPIFLVVIIFVLIIITTKRYMTLAYPSDETFRYDKSTLLISRVKWLDFRNNHWDSHSYSLAEVRKIQYGVIASLRGSSINGLRFDAGGKTVRILPGLKHQDAEKILTVLKAFGADVPDDPLIPSKLKEDNSA